MLHDTYSLCYKGSAVHSVVLQLDLFAICLQASKNMASILHVLDFRDSRVVQCPWCGTKDTMKPMYQANSTRTKQNK